MRLILVMTLVLAWAGAACATDPYTPASADTVLLQRAPGVAKTLRATRAGTVQDPVAIEPAVTAAIAEARRSGDPRYYGQAQALLGSAWNADSPSLALRLLRATLRQQRHEFAGALADLDAVLAADPRNAQARLIRANIHLVQGQPQRARADCAALLGEAGLLVTATCIAAANGLNGQAAAALNTIELALQRDAQAPVPLRLWALTQAAEIAERLGDVARATRYYVTALELAAASGENDVYLKAAYADFLLDQRRFEEVHKHLATETDADALLLRLALAEQQRADAGNGPTRLLRDRHRNELLNRHALAATRGDATHWRERAMVALYLQKDAVNALALARENWAEQHEPLDARLLLQAALALGDKAAARPVIDWLRETRLEDVRLAPLVRQIKALP